MCYLHYKRYFFQRCAPVSYFILSMHGSLSIHTNVFLVENQPDEEHNEEIETAVEQKENLFSFFLVEFLDSFLDEKHIHDCFPLEKKLFHQVSSFSVEENGCVYKA